MPRWCRCSRSVATMDSLPETVAKALVEQMNDDDIRTYDENRWREGIASMLIDDWAGANLDDVLKWVIVGVLEKRRRAV